MESVLVRVGEPADLARIAAIYEVHVHTTVATFDLEPPPEAYWRERLPATLVAKDGGEVVGYAYSAPYRPRAAYARTRETSVYLDDAARGRGVGRALYDALLARLREDGVHQVLAVVALPNDASEALHRACGFTRVGLLPEVGFKLGRWVDTALYGLTLDPARPGTPPGPQG